MNNWGGVRKGAGRPIGWRKENPNPRPQRQLRAYDDEWDIINRFAKLVKSGNKSVCMATIEQLEVTTK